MVCMKIDDGRAMAVSSKNFADGMILPRATPARSGTRHSISVTPRAAAHFRAWATLVIGVGSGGDDFGFFDIGRSGAWRSCMDGKTGRDLQPASVVGGANRRLANSPARMRGASVRFMDDCDAHAAAVS